MSRMIRSLLIAVIAIAGISVAPDAFSQVPPVGVVHVSGHLPYGALRVLSADTLYQVSGDYIIDSGAVLVVAPGTTVQFLPNSRVVDSAHGKIIADGSIQIFYNLLTPGAGQDWCTILPYAFDAQNYDGAITSMIPYAASIFAAANGLPSVTGCSSPYRVDTIPQGGFSASGAITFIGAPVNNLSVEWGNFLILPGADSAYFRNCNFVNFRKDTTVGRFNLYTTDITQGPNVLMAEANGSGAAITTFSQNTYIRNCNFRNNVARIHGGAIAFLEFDSVKGGVIPSGDGRLAVASSDANGSYVSFNAFVNNQVINNYAQRLIPRAQVIRVLPGPAYDTVLAPTYWDVNDAAGGAIYFGGQTTPLNIVLGSNVVFDQWSFDLNGATNNQIAGGFTQGARGGAIFADKLTALKTFNGQFIQNTASTPNNINVGVARQIENMSFGGGIFADTTLSILDDSYFTKNTAGWGGAVYEGAAGKLNIKGPGIVLEYNSARYAGGAVYSLGTSNQINGVGINDLNNEKVVFNSNTAGWAGGAMYDSTNIDSLKWAIFTSNSVHVVDPAFRLNVVGGGAIYAASATNVEGCDFIQNLADTANGGAIYLWNPSTNGNRIFTEGQVNPDPNADTVADQRELTRFIMNTATRNTAEDTIPQRMYSTGLGGALFITIPSNQISFLRTDSTFFSRVRFEGNTAYSGAAVYSDLYDMRLVMSRCLVAENQALSPVDRSRDTIYGISSRIAGSILYGEFEGPLPSYSGPYRGNAVYDNDARFIVRLPDAPLPGLGAGGVDTLRGNFWGDGTNGGNGSDGVKGSPNVTIAQYNPSVPVNTFFVGTIPNTCPLRFPFESRESYTYDSVPIGQIPDTLLFEGRVYDLFDKGTDIKTADYNNRINSPVEDFSLGEPRYLKSNLGPSHAQNVRRLTRDPYLTDVNSNYAKLQTDFVGPQPIGYPLFLEAYGDRKSNDNRSDYDPYVRNYTVYYVLDQNTGDVIRVNMKETSETSNDFRGRVDFVPDRLDRGTLNRQVLEGRPPYDPLELGPLSRFSLSEPTLAATMEGAANYNDSVALGGRRVEAPIADFSSNDQLNQYYNRVSLTNTPIDYYSGERYNALPVLPGDTVLVFSRTVLWKQGYVPAYTEGLRFTIGNVLPPELTGDNLWMAAQPINPNTRMLTEDKKYNPSISATANFPNIPVFVAAGTDTNRFYDPRWLTDSTKYSQLNYFSVTLTQGLGLRVQHWLKDSVFFKQFSEKINFGGNDTVTLGGSSGYMSLYGTPHNPDIVPGGELVQVSVANYPPNKPTEQLAESVGDFNHSIFLYPPYLNCDHTQQDTVIIPSSSTNYEFRVFVQDTPPVFTNTAEKVANLTDSLRYCYDANTDDEAEDNVAQTQGWDFRFGRTSYSFGDPLDPNVAKIQPSWMNKIYWKDSAGQADLTGQSFLTTGLLKIETDSANAIGLLTPSPQINGMLDLDTTASIVCNDGHTGITRNTYAVHVNVEPFIVSQSLPNALEDSDYNVTLLDTSRAILANDPNYGDSLTYYLVYRDTTLNQTWADDTVLFPGAYYDTTTGSLMIKRDNYYSGNTACKFSGVPSVAARVTTPSWLKVNPISGILYGIPGLNDAPHSASEGTTPDTVTVIVRDPYGLVAIKSIPLNVDSINHTPRILGAPPVLCELIGDSVTATFTVVDKDLKRQAPYTDTLQLAVQTPNTGVTITPSTIAGDGSTDSMTITVHIKLNNPVGGRQAVTITATDNGNAVATKTITVNISNHIAWRMNVAVRNNSGGVQPLTFGTGYQATDGIDTTFCEYPLPPIPPADVFDARWIINDATMGTEGSLRDFRDSTLTTTLNFQGFFQAGGNANQTNYPVFIAWNKNDVPTNVGTFYLLDRFNGTVFHINMATGAGFLSAGTQLIQDPNFPGDANAVALEINNSQVTGFYITNATTGVTLPISGTPTDFSLDQNYPNPFNPSTNIRFALPTEQNTKLEVIDVMGRVIATLVNGKLQAGYYNATWDGQDDAGNAVGSGEYFYRLSAGNHVQIRQMSLMK